MPKKQNNPRMCVGIDPGQSGGIVVLTDGVPTMIRVMPDCIVDLVSIFTDLQTEAISACSFAMALEHVSSSPQMGVSSAFTFGQGFGMLTYACTAAGLPFHLVRPQRWQKGLGIPARNKQKGETQARFKKRLLIVAQRLYPKLSLWKQPRTVGVQLAIADALLIAHYASLNL